MQRVVDPTSAEEESPEGLPALAGVSILVFCTHDIAVPSYQSLKPRTRVCNRAWTQFTKSHGDEIS